MADHADIEFVFLLEPVDDLLESRVAREIESVPQSPLHVAVLVLLSSNRLREAEEWQSEIDEAVLVRFKILFAVDNLCSNA